MEEEEIKAIVPANRPVSKRVLEIAEQDDLSTVLKQGVRADESAEYLDEVLKQCVMDRQVRRDLNTVVKQCVRTDRSAEHLDKVLKQDVREIRILKEEDPPFPSPASQEEVLKPLVPNPYENNSWLAIEIEKLLNKKSQNSNSKSTPKQPLPILIN